MALAAIEARVIKFIDKLESWTNNRCCFCLNHYAGLVATICVISTIFYTNAYFSCPNLYGIEFCQYPVYAGYFIVVEILLNFILFHATKKYNRVTTFVPITGKESSPNLSNKNGQPLPTHIIQSDQSIHNRSSSSNVGSLNVQESGQLLPDEKTTTKYCYTCQMNVPIRSHHCPLCGYCVLKKDHHCFFMGGCVGFGNQRYFIVMLFWSCIGAAYGAVLSFSYLNRFFKPFWPLGWIDYIFLFASKRYLFSQHCSVTDLFMTLVFSLGVGAASACLVFSVLQWYLIFKGRTLMEQQLKYRKFNFGAGSTMRRNILNVFGPYWLVNFLIPLPFMMNTHDPSFKQWVYETYVREM